MTQNQPPPFPSLVPESAPFSPEQRAWLNGFFAGMISLDNAGVTALSPEQSAALMPRVPNGAPEAGDGDDGEAPWHDQTLALAERMKLAQGRPLRRRMMAAMAQQDCGQCGYNCQDYSDAIAKRTEERLNLCVPGGKETARVLKTLYQELDSTPATKAPDKAGAAPAVAPAAVPPPATATPAAPAPGAPGCSRDPPPQASLLQRTRLNQPGSETDPRHGETD